MKTLLYLLPVLFLLALPACTSQHTEPQSQEMNLVWADEFDGTELDLAKWSIQTGDGCPALCGWGNNEHQWYTTENHKVADGMLTLTARREERNGKAYTSTRIRTLNKGDWRYGRFEMRARLPRGQGIWPAFWMLPSDNSHYGTWAASGEIDIMEMVGHEPNRVHGTIHYGGAWPDNQSTSNVVTLPSGTFNDDFHVFALEWDTAALRWYLDDELFATVTDWSSTSAPYPAPFDVDFHILLNLAVGGNWPGPPDATTGFPQDFVIDYVRVYQ